ncbi:MAG: hypothetical protein Phyf2KO_16560 [Phycisphaerales bacterium]
MASTHHSFWADFRLFFVRGLAVLLPSIVTLWLLFQAFIFLYNNVAAPINAGIRLVIVEVTPRVVSDPNLPNWFRVTSTEVAQFKETTSDPLLREAEDTKIRNRVRRQKLESFWDTWAFGVLRLTGLLVAIVLLYLGGRVLGSFVGKYFFSRLEALLRAIPGFKQVYPHVKQVVDLIMGDSQMAFRRVVLVQYPRKGIWTIGLVTSSSIKSIAEEVQGDVLAVFIPTSPTPFTGFTINVPAGDCVDVDMTIEQALRFVITAGVLVPEGHEMPAATGVPQIQVPEIQPEESDSQAKAPEGDPEDAKGSES